MSLKTYKAVLIKGTSCNWRLIYSLPACMFDNPNEFSFPGIGLPVGNVNNSVKKWKRLLIASCSMSGQLNMVRFMDLKVSYVR